MKFVLHVFFVIVFSMLGYACSNSVELPMSTDIEPTLTNPPTKSPKPTSLNPSVAVSPKSGPPGTEIQVTAAGFPTDTDIELGVGPKDSEYAVVANARTGANGRLTQALAIPNTAKPDDVWVVVAMARGAAVKAVSNDFEVVAPEHDPIVSISPTSGPPGTRIQVEVQGFPGDAIVEIGVGRENSEYDVINTAQIDTNGSLSTEVSIPGYADLDENWVVVVATENQSLKAVSNVFQVVQTQYHGSVTITPKSGPIGTSVNVEAQGFPPNAVVNIGIGRVNSEYDVVTEAQTDANGRVSTQITIPSFAEPEDTWVIVVAAQAQPIKAVSDEFDITSKAAPSENLFTRTNIYLIAVGDAGGSGKEIGCGDSVIPVEVEIEPTIAPLTAALNKLFALDSREHGQSGLYNALYRSELTVEGIDIENREAIIALTGELVVGGTCDIPRIQAQLRQTALQYDTIDRVSIFVNDQPLDEVLSSRNGGSGE